MRANLSAAAGAARAVAGLAVLLIAAITIALVRSGSFDPYVAAGGVNPSVEALTPDELKATAADKFEGTTAKGGSGYAFEIVQISTIKAQSGGPLIDIPSPTNAREIIGQAVEYPLNILVERGVVRPDGFWSEIRAWPVNGGLPDFEKADLRRSALVRDGVSWRNDRAGWYRADALPGIGLDPATAELWPTLLRDASDATERSNELVDGRTLLRVDASAQKSDIPGVVAADGVAFTKLIAPTEFAFDGQGRVVRIHVVALNLNMIDFDRVVDTVITIRYEDVGGLAATSPRVRARFDDRGHGTMTQSTRRAGVVGHARPVLLSLFVAATSVGIQAIPSDVPLPLDRPAVLQPLTAAAVTCSTHPLFTGHLTASSSSTTKISRITNATVYHYISNIDRDWSCDTLFRYSGTTWNTTTTTGTFKWGNNINSSSPEAT